MLKMENDTMSKKTISKPLTIAMGTALVGGLAAMGSVSADVTAEADPFAMEELSSGYLIAGEEGSCGEGKCGADKKDEGEGSCGEGDEKDEGEGSCGGGIA